MNEVNDYEQAHRAETFIEPQVHPDIDSYFREKLRQADRAARGEILEKRLKAAGRPPLKSRQVGGEELMKLIRINDEEITSPEIIRLQGLWRATARGDVSGIASMLRAERMEEEQRLMSLQQQFRPRSTDPNTEAMRGDTFYFEMKYKIIHEQRILAKAEGVLNQDDKAYIARKIGEYRLNQSRTERSSVLGRIEMAQQEINRIGSLQQLLPQLAKRG